MDDFINVIRKDPQVRYKKNEASERYNRYPYSYQAKIGYDVWIQIVILKELIKVMGTTITDLDIEVKMKNNRNEYLVSKTNCIQRN